MNECARNRAEQDALLSERQLPGPAQDNPEQAAMRRLAQDLSLPFYADEQDFGLSNTDGDRVLEFIQYFDRRTDAPTLERRMLGELILCSLNAALIDRPESVAKSRGEIVAWCKAAACSPEQQHNVAFILSVPDHALVDPNPLSRWWAANIAE